MKRQPYNGWFNRATWNVALWLGNDEGLYNAARELFRQHRGRFTSADAMTVCMELFPSGKTPDNDRLADVHWPEIANDFNEMYGEVSK